jgi:hypothetical protein
MNSEDQNTQQPTSSEAEPKIEDLTLEESPDAQDETVKGGHIWTKDILISS